MSICTLTKSNSRPAARSGRRSGLATSVRRMAACGIAVALVAGCGKKSTPAGPEAATLTLLEAHVLSVAEPSDLAIDETGTILWTVTNHPEKVYQLKTDGTVVKTLSYVGYDLEGIAYDVRDHTLWLAEENRREVVHVDLDGAVLATYPLGLTGAQNSGLEGICVNDSGTVFVLNEKEPGLFIRLKSDVSIETSTGLSFSLDYSGMSYDAPRKCFWITGDQSEKLYLWTPNRVVAEYVLPFPKPEGVAFDPISNRIYVVSDQTNALYVFKSTGSIPSPGAR